MKAEQTDGWDIVTIRVYVKGEEVVSKLTTRAELSETLGKDISPQDFHAMAIHSAETIADEPVKYTRGNGDVRIYPRPDYVEVEGTPPSTTIVPTTKPDLGGAGGAVPALVLQAS